MKLYIWKRKDTANNMLNFYPLSREREISFGTGEKGIYPVACHAFFKKKEAIKYLHNIGWDNDTIKSFELITIDIS